MVEDLAAAWVDPDAAHGFDATPRVAMRDADAMTDPKPRRLAPRLIRYPL